MEGLILVAVAIVLYFSPVLIAYSSGKRNRLAILALNALLGWTVVGWIAALIWALTQDASVRYVELPPEAGPVKTGRTIPFRRYGSR